MTRLRPLRRRASDRHARLAAALSVIAGVAVFLVAVEVFPYHSTNHDEAVYLQQAAMLLEGKIFLRPPVEGSFRPWFFVRADAASPGAGGAAGGPALYSKYAPVTAAVFAVGEALWSYRLALPAVAAAVVGLTYGVVGEAFDRRTGLLAALLLSASPLFLVQSALFLPYAPTTALNLPFAFFYLRADRTGRRRDAAVAGLAVGLAFFSRPYTAVLFAAPFVAHALWTLRDGDRAALERQAATAALGLCGVGATLGYNALMTGSPLVFPYEAFAPRDGLGFGRRALRGYERTYTPAVALETNARVLAELFGEWVVAGPLGTALAAGGLVAVAVRRRWDARRAAIAGLFVTVAAGNVYFWGNLNVLGALDVPDDGLVEYYGPYYHFDLLLPTVAFAARGAVVGRDELARRTSERFDRARAGRVVAAALLVSAAAFGGAAAVAAADPLRENAAVSAQLDDAYRPFEERSFDDAVVFLPTPYGDWLNHPFQALRNDPGFDGDAVYAVRENQFAVADAYPDRALYRYGYRGEWSPLVGPPVDPTLQRVRVVGGERVVLRNSLGVPDAAERVSIRVATDRGHAYYAATDPGETLDFRLATDGRRVRLAGEVAATGNAFTPVAPRDDVRVTAFVDYGAGSGFSYRLEVPVERSNGTVRALTPYAEICRDPRHCAGEAAYVPGETRLGVSVDTRFVGNATESGGR